MFDTTCSLACTLSRHARQRNATSTSIARTLETAHGSMFFFTVLCAFSVFVRIRDSVLSNTRVNLGPSVEVTDPCLVRLYLASLFSNLEINPKIHLSSPHRRYGDVPPSVR